MPKSPSRLAADYVIHTVGPVWQDGNSGEPEALASCYRRSLEEARRLACETVAFPCISTGVYGFPRTEAARIAIETVADALRGHDTPRSVTFCCFLEDDETLYRRLVPELLGNR